VARTLQLALFLLLSTACAFGHGFDAELEEIATLLALEPGMHVADVGAGDGEFGVALAARVRANGHVWVQEIDDGELRKIRKRAKRSGLDNLTVVEGTSEATMLPDDCCDAVLLRFVYHHMSEREVMLDDLRRAVRPGGLLLVIERGERGGHGIPSAEVVEDWTERGFELVERRTAWGGHDDHSAVLFRR
jgi:ubiquinone/menaquinone biosynthesis C-methylase UbiE